MSIRDSNILMAANSKRGRKGNREEALLRLVPKMLGILL
jgi:hypothetical protein